MNLITNKILLFFPIRYFTNWIKFIKGTFIFKINLNYKLNKNKFISNIISQEKRLIKKKSFSIKYRGEIAHSNKKPRPQKGTGKSRAGTLNSPLWKGGGVIFGPNIKFSLIKITNKTLKISKYLLILNKKNNILIIKLLTKFPYYSKTILNHIKIQLVNVGISLNSKILFINTTRHNLNNIFKLVNVKIIDIFNLLTFDLLIYNYIIIFI
uniref:Large ribosomal subunit protein uL4m n=1 Tax=Nephromyces sp. ex Molgula occidentalis TaxID=2544991 RepID=A0A5C1H8D5_9APIC|nr:50S ribosomal protein L4 [Nephromyces sp. ex Molgula occidentalis]